MLSTAKGLSVQRVIIGNNYVKQPFWKILLGVPLIYLPIITTVPFMVIGVVLIRAHLRSVGGMAIRSYWEFVPAWISHRYGRHEQPVIEKPWYHPGHYRFFWIFNCKIYCPLSVALFSYAAYLVKIVENWWCPFAHEQKKTYAESAIDESFWHMFPEELEKLHPEDRKNPIWDAGRAKGDP